MAIVTFVWTFLTKRKLKRTTNSFMAYQYIRFHYYFRLYVFLIHGRRMSATQMYSVLITWCIRHIE